MKACSISKEIKDSLIAPIPEALIKQREGGKRNGQTIYLKYIAGSSVTDILNKTFGYVWSWQVKEQWVQESQPFFNQYSKSREKEFYNGKEGAWEAQAPVAHVLGTLKVHLKDDNGNMFTVEKDGFGSKAIVGKQSDQDSIFKAAGTDALKKAASLFGVGLELYRDEEEKQYFEEINYEDPWTDEMTQKYEKEINYVFKYFDDCGADDNYIREVIQYAAKTNDYDILPTNIKAVYDYIVSISESQQGE